MRFCCGVAVAVALITAAALRFLLLSLPLPAQSVAVLVIWAVCCVVAAREEWCCCYCSSWRRRCSNPTKLAATAAGWRTPRRHLLTQRAQRCRSTCAILISCGPLLKLRSDGPQGRCSPPPPPPATRPPARPEARRLPDARSRASSCFTRTHRRSPARPLARPPVRSNPAARPLVFSPESIRLQRVRLPRRLRAGCCLWQNANQP